MLVRASVDEAIRPPAPLLRTERCTDGNQAIFLGWAQRDAVRHRLRHIIGRNNQLQPVPIFRADLPEAVEDRFHPSPVVLVAAHVLGDAVDHE